MVLFCFAQVRYSTDLQSCAQLVCQGGAHGGEAAGEQCPVLLVISPVEISFIPFPGGGGVCWNSPKLFHCSYAHSAHISTLFQPVLLGPVLNSLLPQFYQG